MRTISLSELELGQWGVIRRLLSDAPMRDRMIELGFIPGCLVQRQFSNRAGSLSAYRVADACIALRKKDAQSIRVIPR